MAGLWVPQVGFFFRNIYMTDTGTPGRARKNSATQGRAGFSTETDGPGVTAGFKGILYY